MRNRHSVAGLGLARRAVPAGGRESRRSRLVRAFAGGSAGARGALHGSGGAGAGGGLGMVQGLLAAARTRPGPGRMENRHARQAATGPRGGGVGLQSVARRRLRGGGAGKRRGHRRGLGISGAQGRRGRVGRAGVFGGRTGVGAGGRSRGVFRAVEPEGSAAESAGLRLGQRERRAQHAAGTRGFPDGADDAGAGVVAARAGGHLRAGGGDLLGRRRRGFRGRHVFGVELVGALRTQAVAEFGLGMRTDVGLDLVPVALVVADFLAGHADGQQPAEDLDFREGVFAFRDELLAFLLGLLARGDVGDAGQNAGLLAHGDDHGRKQAREQFARFLAEGELQAIDPAARGELVDDGVAVAGLRPEIQVDRRGAEGLRIAVAGHGGEPVVDFEDLAVRQARQQQRVRRGMERLREFFPLERQIQQQPAVDHEGEGIGQQDKQHLDGEVEEGFRSP